MDRGRRKEIYTYEANWTIYGLNWSERRDQDHMYRLAIGSFIDKYSNCVEILQYNEQRDELVRTARFDHPYPTTKIMWIPDPEASHPDLLTTSGDYLRVWQVDQDSGSVSCKCMLNRNSKSEYCAPLSSFDWSATDPNIIGTSSIDTTCTIWDINAEKSTTQLIAHDEEVYDFGFAPSKDLFASVGRDGSLRMFDLRNLEHSTIVYETPGKEPLLRLEWNKQDTNYIATFSMGSNTTTILDIRQPSKPVSLLRGHKSSVNAVAWAPHSSCHICTASDDHTTLIWDVKKMPSVVDEPILSYEAEAEINNLKWSSATRDWVAIAFGNKVQALRV